MSGDRVTRDAALRIGKAGYDAYVASATRHPTIPGVELPTWAELGPAAHAAWCAAGLAMAREIVDQLGERKLL